MTSSSALPLAGFVPTAAALDVGESCVFLGSGIARRAGRSRIGRALTVQTGAGDNLALHRAVAAASPGDVLVVSCPGPPVGLAGEVICTALHARGVRGLVTDSGVRDYDALIELGFPVWSADLVPRGTTKHDPGGVGGSVEIAGSVVRTGDVVLADGDGVVCVPAAAWTQIRGLALAKERQESDWLEQLRLGTRLEALTRLL